MPIQVDLPYPSTDAITEDCRTLRAISPAYAGAKSELTAILQYVYQSILLEEAGMEEEGKTILGIAVAEMHHLEILGTVIVKLGAPPVFTACPPYPVGYYSASAVNYAKTPALILAADIAAEKGAIADYRRIISQICNDDVAAIIERIILDEELHLSIFEEMYRKLCNKEN